MAPGGGSATSPIPSPQTPAHPLGRLLACAFSVVAVFALALLASPLRCDQPPSSSLPVFPAVLPALPPSGAPLRSTSIGSSKWRVEASSGVEPGLGHESSQHSLAPSHPGSGAHQRSLSRSPLGLAAPGAGELSLEEVVRKVGGDSKRSKREKSIIIVATVSAYYLDFLENWFISVSRVGHGGSVVFLAEDDDAYAYVKVKWPTQAVRAAQVVADDMRLPGQKGGQKGGYNSPVFNRIVGRRPRYFMALLNLNVTFLYSDIDTVWLKDPFPFLASDYDMLFQEDASVASPLSRWGRGKGLAPGPPIIDKEHELCTGFVYARPTRASKIIVQLWVTRLEEARRKQGKETVNQKVFNAMVRSLPSGGGFRLGVLPDVYFPCGCLFFPTPHLFYCVREKGRDIYVKRFLDWSSRVVVVHGNWAQDKDTKRQRFKKFGMWYLAGNDTLSQAPSHEKES